jgi:hypothetical protein
MGAYFFKEDIYNIFTQCIGVFMKYLCLPGSIFSTTILGACIFSTTLLTGCDNNSTATSPSLNTNSKSSLATEKTTISPCAGDYILCDDFDGAEIDQSVWIIAHEDIGGKYPNRPENISLTTLEDKGETISVVKSTTYGDLHEGAKRQGGLIKTRHMLGGGRYEIRMKNLPGPFGCSCFWNYYDSENEITPPAERIYTEIDIEMPANLKPAPGWQEAKITLGLNTWSHTDRDEDATYINHASTNVNPFDGEFHVYRIDWYDGQNGELRIDWYVDDVLQASTSEHVGDHPATLYAGAWPAPWPVMRYDFDTADLYIDWIRVSAL